MTDYPIIFLPEMVEALLAGRKTMTRRLRWVGALAADGVGMRESTWARVKLGDRLWVRESWRAPLHLDDMKPRDFRRGGVRVYFDADGAFDGSSGRARAAFHLPRVLSRITLIVTKAPKIERLQAISQADAAAEGVERDVVHPQLFNLYCQLPGNRPGFMKSAFAKVAFRSLWMKLHGAGAWEANPEVVALTFRVVVANIDSPEAQAA